MRRQGLTGGPLLPACTRWLPPAGLLRRSPRPLALPGRALPAPLLAAQPHRGLAASVQAADCWFPQPAAAPGLHLQSLQLLFMAQAGACPLLHAAAMQSAAGAGTTPSRCGSRRGARWHRRSGGGWLRWRWCEGGLAALSERETMGSGATVTKGIVRHTHPARSLYDPHVQLLFVCCLVWTVNLLYMSRICDV